LHLETCSVERLFSQFALPNGGHYPRPAEFGPREIRDGNNVKQNCAQVGDGPFKKRTCDTQHMLCGRGKICIDSYHNAPVHDRSTYVP
jgi:hypothetical protein